MEKSAPTNLPSKFSIGDKIRLVDASWAILIPSYWAAYIQVASRVNIATFKVIEVRENDTYLLAVMDIVPEQGRVHIPAGLSVTTTIKEIQAALALSYKAALT